jgi:hypothetical protein
MKKQAVIRCLIVIIMVAAASNVTRGSEGTTSVLVPADSYEINVADRGHEISVNGFGRLQVPGKPCLPSRIFAIAVPPGAEVTDVHFFPEASTVLSGTYRIPPVAMAGILSGSDSGQEEYEENLRSVYGSDDPYPSVIGEVVRRAAYRKYNLVDVRITPFSYRPESGKLTHHKKIKVEVHYTLPGEPLGSTVKDNLPRTEAIAKEIIFNYDQARSFHLDSETVKNRGLYDYVIITLPSLTAAVQPLVDWETSKNRNVKVVTTDWITVNYPGCDLSERMRNFLRDKYPSQEWGIEDVLLVGHYDDVPMRLVWQDVGYGKPRTDYYYAELSLPDSQSWDKDGDLQYCEDEDPIDFYTEVNVSRIPWSESATVSKICNKSVLYEQNNDPSFKKNILLLGAFYWPDTDCAYLMEAKSDQPWMSSWTTTRMYEKNSTAYSIFPCDMELVHSNVTSVLPTGKYAFMNYGGHGSPTSCHISGYGASAFITAGDSTLLDDNYPAIMFADACSNSDPNHINIGMKMMKQGAVAFLGSTCVAYGQHEWDDPYDGNSSSLDYFFTTGVTSNDYSIAGAHQWSMRHMYTHGAWVRGPAKYQIPGWGSLAGNPDLRMGPLPALIIDYDEESVGKYMPPGPEIAFNIKIRPGAGHYAPGTGYLCYRFDSGNSYTDVPLTPLGGDLFEALIPSTKPGDEPQFYFSARTAGGSTVYYPENAPAEVLSFDVCIQVARFEDDFETDRGWTVQNPYILDGPWERADPVGTEAQPEDDHTASGTHCFVTGADGGGIDQNDLDGESYLTSPVLDMAGDDPIVSFYLWFYHSMSGTQQPLEVHVSNDNGTTWTPVLEAFNCTEWVLRSFRVSDYVTPTSTMRVRFLAFDNPSDSTVEALVDDFRVDHLDYEASLWADAYSIAEVLGGSVEFKLDAGPVNGGRYYLVLGSLSGTLPGSPLPGGFADLPLNWDAFTDLALLLTNSPVFMNFLNQLDLDGRATATLNAPPIPPGYAGLKMSYAYVLNNPFDFASNPVNIEIER